MKKTHASLFLALALTAGVLAGCGSPAATATSSSEAAKAEASATTSASAATESAETVTVKIGAAVVPHAEILEFAKPLLKAKGVNLEVEILDDEGQLNPALAEGQIDANYFQHVPYLNSVSAEKGYKFTTVAKVHVEPIGVYSQKIAKKEELKDGATIAIPNNPSNEFRALTLLQANGLIKLKDGIDNFSATPNDIAENPHNYTFVEVDAAQLVRSLPDVDAAVINTNYILEAKIDPKTALFREDANSPYANIVVVRSGDETKPVWKTVTDVLNSADVKKFIEDKYGVAVVPAF